MNRQCGNCVFWVRHQQALAGAVDLSPEGQFGECRAIPPQVIFGPIEEAGGQLGYATRYPEMPATFAGCGMFKAKEPK